MSRICESQTIEGIQEARRAGCTAIVIAGKGVGVKSIVQGELLSVAAWYDNETAAINSPDTGSPSIFVAGLPALVLGGIGAACRLIHICTTLRVGVSH